jgi:hypothetical protein
MLDNNLFNDLIQSNSRKFKQFYKHMWQIKEVVDCSVNIKYY